MKYYFIYSAGGGAGDWNGVKRVWNQYMPTDIKSRMLLKFGDIFLEHASGRNFIRPERWREICNLREWLYSNVNDDFVEDEGLCDFLLDSGTAKAVNYIEHHNPRISCNDLINAFDDLFEEYSICQKYTDIVYNSKVNRAVTFDIPNPFKIRSQNGNARLNIIDRETNHAMVMVSARYANDLFSAFCDMGGLDFASNTLTTVVNGLWSEEELNDFFNALNFNPRKIAIGALSSSKTEDFNSQIQLLKNCNMMDFETIHFLGCGGFKKVALLKENEIDGNNISVDCSTFFNRSIDGSTNGNAQSGYFDYNTQRLIRINPNTKQAILHLHERANQPLYTVEEIENIIDLILLHQSGHSSYDTYDARAKLSFHNFDVFKQYAEL